MNANQLKILKRAALFQEMNDEEFASLISCFSPQVKHFSKGEVVILAGYPVSRIGIILSGNAVAYSEHVDGNRTIMANLAASSVFGDALSSAKTRKSPVTVCAITDITVMLIKYEQVLSMCSTACFAHRMLLQNMLKSISEKCFLLFDHINILREKTLRQRIKAYLHILSDGGELNEVTLPFTKTMLADYLLANRSALSKELSKMQRDGIIEVEGRKIRII